MGFFDYYYPKAPILCPRCGRELSSEWQGKNGLCDLDHWNQGKIHPTGTNWPEECLNCTTAEYLESKIHPDGRFIIYADCETCKDFIHAEITVQEGLWKSTRLLTPEDIDVVFWHLPRERRAQMKVWLSKTV